MVDVFLERIVGGRYAPDELIAASESLRQERFEDYLQRLDSIIDHLRTPGAVLLQQPHFDWPGVGQSPCFLFERHRVLNNMRLQASDKADTLREQEAYPDAAEQYVMAALFAARMLENRERWTAIQPELVRQEEMQHNWLFSRVSAAKAMQQHCLWLQKTSDIDAWKHGNITETMREAQEHSRVACGFIATSVLAYSREHTNTKLPTTEPSSLEQLFRQHYHRTSSYVADNFEQRLSHAVSACQLHPPPQDCVDILTLNNRLYYLEEKPAADPPHLKVQEVLAGF